jgi:hypothetical protein
MLAYVTILERSGPALSSAELVTLQAEFPSVRIHVGETPGETPGEAPGETSGEAPGEAPGASPSTCPPLYPSGCPWFGLDAGAFWAADFDAHRVDCTCEELAGRGAFALRLEGDGVSAETVFAVLTRYQRFLGRRNPASAGSMFDRVLARHRELHDCRKPLVRADLEHALDTWQWLLRLDPSAGVAVQIAALFHDVERLVSEADVRIEQHASDYRAFKDEHARRGGAMTRAALAATGLDAAIIDRAADLVADHERPSGDAERLLLNEADALSFFSLNSTGFLRYYGVEHTRRKIAYTLARLRESARWRLHRIRYHPTVADMLREAGITTYTWQERHGALERAQAVYPARTGGAR